jgi:hypothetical protein
VISGNKFKKGGGGDMGILMGMAAIASHMGRTPSTVMSLIKQYRSLPIKKVGGVWESDTESIDTWKRRYFEGIESKTEEIEDPVEKRDDETEKSPGKGKKRGIKKKVSSIKNI